MPRSNADNLSNGTSRTSKIVAGGGYVNTELRELSEPAVFNYLDFITLDDGERPLLNILESLQGERKAGDLTRTFTTIDREVRYVNDDKEECISHTDIGCPDYSDLALDRYLSLIEIANPMHRLWSDGRWNKLTIAHGCYWHKCSFCDTTLDYIKRFDSASATVLVDRIEEPHRPDRPDRVSFCRRGCAARRPERTGAGTVEKKDQHFLVDQYPL